MNFLLALYLLVIKARYAFKIDSENTYETLMLLYIFLNATLQRSNNKLKTHFMHTICLLLFFFCFTISEPECAYKYYAY